MTVGIQVFEWKPYEFITERIHIKPAAAECEESFELCTWRNDGIVYPARTHSRPGAGEAV